MRFVFRATPIPVYLRNLQRGLHHRERGLGHLHELPAREPRVGKRRAERAGAPEMVLEIQWAVVVELRHLLGQSELQ